MQQRESVREVRPDLPGDDAADVVLADAESTSQNGLLFSPRPAAADLLDLIAGHAVLPAECPAPHGSSVSLAARDTALGGGILIILVTGSEEEVIGSDASTNVAPVTDKETIRDGAPVKYPTEAGGSHLQARSSRRLLKEKLPIAAAIASTVPYPTAVGLDDLLPEAGLEWESRVALMITARRTELLASVSPRDNKLDTTVGSRAANWGTIPMHADLQSVCRGWVGHTTPATVIFSSPGRGSF